MYKKMYGTIEFQYWITLSTKHLLNEAEGMELGCLLEF